MRPASPPPIVRNRSFVDLMGVYILYTASMMLLGILFEPYFLTLGLSIEEIVLSSAFLYLPPILLALLLRRFSARFSMAVSIMLAMGASAVLSFFPDPSAPFIARALIGVSLFGFWAPFNILYYRFTKSNAAFMGSIYYSVGPLLSLIIPGLAGLLAASLGYGFLFSASLASLALVLVMAYFLIEDEEFVFDPKKSLDSIPGFRTLFFLEGFSVMAITGITLRAMMLLYFKDPIGFGGILSAATLFSVISSLLAGRLSDALKGRRTMLVLSMAGFIIGALLCDVSTEASLFFLGMGLVNFFSSIFLPLPLAILFDNSEDFVHAVVGRELMLNSGRLLAISLGSILISMLDIRAMLLLQCIGAGLYLIVFEKKRPLMARH